MLKGDKEFEKRRTKILEEFGSHQKSLNHGRHFNYEKVRDSGVNVTLLEEDKPLQDAVLRSSVHHTFIVTFSMTRAIKIVENHLGAAFVQAA